MAMWQEHDDPFTNPFVRTLSIPYKWGTQLTRPSRSTGVRITPFKIGTLLFTVASFVIIRDRIAGSLIRSSMDIHKAATISQAAFQPPESGAYRVPDTIDTFASYNYRNVCNVPSLDLHAPFSPLCQDRASMLTAMSSGGRIGNDAPYMPRGCDMRWFSSKEVCEILGRFERVIIIGDSMLRHVTGSINILLREDIGYGAVTDWNFSTQESKDCFCNEQFNVKACSIQGIYKTADVLVHDPKSFSCKNPLNLMMEVISIKTAKSFIFGHGLWSNLDLQKTVTWLDTILHTIRITTGSDWQGLFVTPNASGKDKPDEWIVSQGNKALMWYEEAVGNIARERGLEHLGTWN